MARYNFLAVPVVDDQNVLMGIVTVDDIIDVIQEEAQEDILKMVGAGADLEAIRPLYREVDSASSLGRTNGHRRCFGGSIGCWTLCTRR